MSILALNWYEYAEQSLTWQRFWREVCNYLPIRGAIEFYSGNLTELVNAGNYDLAWTCGGDVAVNPNRFMPITVPIFAHSKLPNGYYKSLILRRQDVRDASLRSLSVGVNYPQSVSGHMALAKWWFHKTKKNPFNVVLTGAHEASAQALLSGTIDIAAIDYLGYEFLLRAYPKLAQTCEIIGHTDIIPAPPLCIPADTGTNLELSWRASFEAASKALQSKIIQNHGLGIVGFHSVQASNYRNLSRTLKEQISAAQVFIPIDRST